MSVVENDGVLAGRIGRPRNDAQEEKGSIHDDDTATDLGFRGGTVAGSIHMDQFVPVLLAAFGFRWFETGSLSLYFNHATVDDEPVQAFADVPASHARDTEAIRVWMDRVDEQQSVASGTASAVGVEGAELQTRDLRAGDHRDLRMLRELAPGDAIPAVTVNTAHILAQQERFFDYLTEPLDWYVSGEPWGGPIACPRSLIHLLFLDPAYHFAQYTGHAVGLFGAIELEHVAGPLILGRTYSVDGEVVAVGESPKTEYVWFDSQACDSGGVPIARMRMLLRYLKASSSRYSE